VGYGKPPREHQFVPGQSGNRAGRKKGSRGLKTDLHAELSSVLTISINKQPVSGTKQRLMLKSLATRAAAGDVRASALLLPLIMQIFGIEDRGTDRRTLSRQDQALLDDLLAGAEPETAESDQADPTNDPITPTKAENSVIGDDQ
jgi:hypothetical protein